MPPKADPNEVKFLRIKVFGGEGGPAATLAPKLGPLGLNAKKIQEDIVKVGSAGYKGIRCMVELKCQNRAATISILPTTSALLIKEMGGHERDRKKTKNVVHNGDLTLDQIKKIAKTMETEGKSMAKSLEGTVKSVLGTAQSLGATVNKQSPKEIIAQINAKEIIIE